MTAGPVGTSGICRKFSEVSLRVICHGSFEETWGVENSYRKSNKGVALLREDDPVMHADGKYVLIIAPAHEGSALEPACKHTSIQKTHMYTQRTQIHSSSLTHPPALTGLPANEWAPKQAS